MDLIHYQNVITAFALFVHSRYLLKTVVLATIHVTVVMVADRMSAVSN